MMYNSDEDISALVGKTLTEIENYHNEELIFHTDDGETYRMYHDQDCCEYVSIEDICGDLGNLIDSPIISAYMTTETGEEGKDYSNSHTWTFYNLATNKGSVTIRWYGSSNGYYSERVDFIRVGEGNY